MFGFEIFKMKKESVVDPLIETKKIFETVPGAEKPLYGKLVDLANVFLKNKFEK